MQEYFKKGDRLEVIKSGEQGTVLHTCRIYMTVRWDKTFTNAKESISLGKKIGVQFKLIEQRQNNFYGISK